MSGDGLSDSQDLSKSESLLSEFSSSATETDSILDDSVSESSISSRPPQNNVVLNETPRINIPVVDLIKEGSPDLDNDNPPDLKTVRGVSASSNLLFSSDGTPHFPLLWSLEPHKVPQVDLDTLSEGDKVAVKWLRKQDLPDCSALLENEDNPAGLQTLLGNMPPKSQTTKTMDEVAMETEGKPLHHAKKQKIDDGGKPEGKDPNPPPSGSNQNTASNTIPNPVPGNSDKWWALLNDFEGSTSDIGSIFDHRFPIGQIVEKHLNQQEDRVRVHRAGMKNLGKKLQSSGAQMAFFGLCVDQYVGSAEKEMKKALLKNKELTDKLKNVEGGMKTIERLRTDLLAKNKNLVAEKDSLVAELGDIKAEVAVQHTAGFEKVVSQLKFLYPNLKVDEIGAFKHVVDGKLVDILVDEDEE
ncbi:hypothetical protein SESBI_19917 [Sesbania bispinosa]|nr:hypothetical protein SESBI_19917 [Sesbania bispinosa]